MSLLLLAKLAWRNLWRNYRRTLIMLMAIILGVWAMILMNALMRGMVDGVLDSGLKYLPGHAQLHHPAYREDPGVAHSLGALSAPLQEALADRDIRGWSARVKVPAMISSERDSRGVVLLGVDPVQEVSIGFAVTDVVQGRFLESAADPSVVVGEAMLKRLETRLGRRIVLSSQTVENEVGERGFRIAGVYRASLPSLEETVVYAGREVVQGMLGMGGAVSEVAILGPDYRRLEPWFGRVAAAVDEGMVLEGWRELDGYLALTLSVQDGASIVLIVVIFLALSFGLVNTMAMAVFERVREMGLLQALGMPPRAMLYQVLLEALFLLLLGLLAGNLLGWLSLQPLLSGIDLSALAEAAEMSGMGATLYPNLRGVDMLRATLIVIFLGLAASLIPAWRAARLDPVKSMNEY